jgi:hypothetical protein
MPLIDDRGRLFGRLNIVDAAVGLVVGLLIPLVYGAYILFRPPLPRLVAIEPSQVEQGATRVEVRGEHLTPAFRLMVGDASARFLLADSQNGVLEIPPLQPGSYDVQLLDQYQELSRLPGALTVLEPATVIGEVAARGSFSAPDSAQAQVLWRELQATGQDAARPWNVLEVQPPEPGAAYSPPPGGSPLRGAYQVRATIRFRCEVRGTECTAFGVPLSGGALVPVPVSPDGEVDAPFRVIDVHPVYTSVLDVALRAAGCSQGSYLTSDELTALREAASNGNARSPVEEALLPSIESFDVQGETSSGELIVIVQLRVPAVSTDAGWMHGMGNYRDSAGMLRGSLLRTGAYFIVEDRSLELCGRIVGVGPATPLN